VPEPPIRIRPALPVVKVPAEQFKVNATPPIKLAKAVTDVTVGVTPPSEIVRPLNVDVGVALMENGAVPFVLVELSICTIPIKFVAPVESFNFA
jgi:hypothetical protein